MYQNRWDRLPYEFMGLEDRVEYVRRKGTHEYSSSCPYKCNPNNGGELHDDGSFPDRFRMFLRANGKRPIIGWCRNCNRIWYPGIDKDEWKHTEEEYEAWIMEREQYEQSVIAEAQASLDRVRSERLWETYHDNADDSVRALFYARNIPDEWIDYWSLGYNPSIKVNAGGRWVKTGGASIPLFEPVSRDIKNIKYRLFNTYDGVGKYRYEVSHVPAPLFFTDLSRETSGHVIAVEGEFKAMRVYIELNDMNRNVVGIPSNSPDKDSLLFPNCDKVTLILDPDSYDRPQSGKPSRLERAVDVVGKDRARVVDLPAKVDDMFDEGSLSGRDLASLIDTARVPW